MSYLVGFTIGVLTMYFFMHHREKQFVKEMMKIRREEFDKILKGVCSEN